MSVSQSPNVRQAGQFNKFVAIVLLSMPAILGTGFFLTGVIASQIFDMDGPHVDPFQEPTTGERVKMALGFALFLACYFGAAFGPVLLPLAGALAFGLTRAVGLRARVALWAWTIVVLGFAATGLFWGWLINLDIFV